MIIPHYYITTSCSRETSQGACVMMKMICRFVLAIITVSIGTSATQAQDSATVSGPVKYIYAKRGNVALRAYVFQPATPIGDDLRSAVVVFHGGGWYIGAPEWAFGRARHFAELGMVGVAAQFRLCTDTSITPLELMADARDLIRWLRATAERFWVHPDRITAYGWSSGAHLAASAAIFLDSTTEQTWSAVPNALICVSPALHLEIDSWAKELLGSRADVSSISPATHVRPGLPPTLILIGSEDTVTPLTGSQLFTTRMLEAKNRCDLHVFPGVGHLFTPDSLPDTGQPQPDSATQATAWRIADEFLMDLGFID